MRYILLLALIISLQSAFACKCYEVTITENVKSADVIFSGKVLSRYLTTNYDSLDVSITKNLERSNLDWSKIPVAVSEIEVLKTYKGAIQADTITILTPPNGASCGFRFQVGSCYVIYATIKNSVFMPFQITDDRILLKNMFWTNMCTRTQEWNTEEETAILKVLNTKNL